MSSRLGASAATGSPQSRKGFAHDLRSLVPDREQHEDVLGIGPPIEQFLDPTGDDLPHPFATGCPHDFQALATRVLGQSMRIGAKQIESNSVQLRAREQVALDRARLFDEAPFPQTLP